MVTVVSSVGVRMEVTMTEITTQDYCEVRKPTVLDDVLQEDVVLISNFKGSVVRNLEENNQVIRLNSRHVVEEDIVRRY